MCFNILYHEFYWCMLPRVMYIKNICYLALEFMSFFTFSNIFIETGNVLVFVRVRHNPRENHFYDIFWIYRHFYDMFSIYRHFYDMFLIYRRLYYILYVTESFLFKINIRPHLYIRVRHSFMKQECCVLKFYV